MFLGYEANAAAAADTNEIVIGEGATGNGSNTTTIGNGSTTTTYIKGTLIGGNSVFVTGAGTAITSIANVTTGLALPAIPAGTNVRGRCTIIWQQSSTTPTVTFSLVTSQAPTHLLVVANSYSTIIANQVTSITTATTTAITAALAPTAKNTNYYVNLDLSLENGGSANSLTVDALESSSTYTLTIEPGSSCGWLP